MATLTPRERQVFDLIVRGKINKQIANELGTTERTVKAHRHEVMEKMQVNSLAELVSIAERLGLLDRSSQFGSLVGVASRCRAPVVRSCTKGQYENSLTGCLKAKRMKRRSSANAGLQTFELAAAL